MSSEAGQWNTTLFSCTEDWTTCCRFLWIPCCAYAEQGQLVFGDSTARYLADVFVYFVLCALRLEWTVGTVRREDIRIKYNIPAGPYDDLVLHFCCHPCAACQETRRLKSMSRTAPDVVTGPSTRGNNGDDPNLPPVTFERHVDYVMSGGVRKEVSNTDNKN